MANQFGIQVENLTKLYKGGVCAVDDISFEVKQGKIFGFLGPNGAGKSTTVKILTTLALPTSGVLSIGGYDVVKQADQVRRIAGVALQDIGIDPMMKPLELLTLQGRLFGMKPFQAETRGKELLELVRLTEASNRRSGTFSGGMRRRLDLALALVHEPEILFLDEPTTGLDPASRRDVWEEVRRLNRQLGMTIFLTTQYLEEADELAESIAIIDKGKIVAEGSPAELKASIGNESINLVFPTTETARKAAVEIGQMGDQFQIDRDTVRLYLRQATLAVPSVMEKLQHANLATLSLTITQPTLDDVFLQVTGNRLAEHSGEAEKVLA